jgi:hypothetical protein
MILTVTYSSHPDMLNLTILTMTHSSHAETYNFDYDIFRNAETDDFDHGTLKPS